MPTTGEWAVIVFLVYMVAPIALYLLWVGVKAILKPIQKRRKKRAAERRSAEETDGEPS